MTEIQAWQQIFSLSRGSQWQAIPENLKRFLGLDSRIGICGGLLITKHSAEYANAFITRVNSTVDSIQERIK